VSADTGDSKLTTWEEFVFVCVCVCVCVCV